MNTKEKLIKLLNEKFSESDNNIVHLYKDMINSLNISETKASRILHLIESEQLIIIRNKPTSNNFNMCWTIELLSPCVYYFENQKQIKIQNRNNWIQLWIPISLSIIALVVAIIDLFL